MTREPPTKTIKRKTQITNKCQFSCCSLTCMQYESQVIDWCYKHRRTRTLLPLQTDWIIVWSIFFGSSCNRISDSKFLFYIFILILKRQIFFFVFPHCMPFIVQYCFLELLRFLCTCIFSKRRHQMKIECNEHKIQANQSESDNRNARMHEPLDLTRAQQRCKHRRKVLDPNFNWDLCFSL